MTIQEAAARLRLAPITVRDYLRKGRLPGVKVGRGWRMRESDLAHIERHGWPAEVQSE